MNRVAATIFCLLLPAWAFGDPIRVQTGEHETFTRVVVPLGEGAEWQLNRQADGYRLQMDPPREFELTGFFDLIPRERIVDVTLDEDEAALNLKLGCDCVAETFVFRDRFLVVDIGEVGAIQTSVEPKSLEGVGEQSVAVKGRFLIPEEAVIPLFPTDAEEPRGYDLSGAANGNGPDPFTQVGMPTLSEEQTRSASMLADELLQSVGRALSEGLLEAGDEQGDSQGDSNLNLEAAPPGIAARTSIEALALDLVPNVERLNCLENSHFAFADWGNDGDVFTQISSAKDQAFPEDNLTDPNAALALARLYLRFGFDLEAIRIIDQDGRNSRELRVTRALAQIMSGQGVTDDILAGQQACNSDVALWALLAYPGSGMMDDNAHSELLQVFRKLPPLVRGIVGPILAEYFLGAGDVESARQIAERIPDEIAGRETTVLIESGLEEAQGRDGASKDILLEAVANDRVLSPAVMERLFEVSQRAETRLEPEAVMLAESMTTDDQIAQQVAAMTQAQFEYHLSAADFTQAAQLLQTEAASFIDTEESRKIAYASAAVEQMADAEFARFAWNDALLPEDDFTREAIAARLQGIGFATRAQQIRPTENLLEIAGNEARAEVPNTLNGRTNNQSAQSQQLSAESSALGSGQPLQQAIGLIESSQRMRTNIIESLDALQMDELQ